MRWPYCKKPSEMERCLEGWIDEKLCIGCEWNIPHVIMESEMRKCIREIPCVKEPSEKICLGCMDYQYFGESKCKPVEFDPLKNEEKRLEAIRRFETGATRDTEEGKPDYEGFFAPIVLKRFGEYMHKHRKQSDGNLRASDNWQKGIPKDAYMKSGWRHFMDWWSAHRGFLSREGIEEALCGIIFNAMGYLFELLKERGYGSEGKD